MLAIPRPALPHLAHGLTKAQHAAAAKKWKQEGITGLTVSTIGGAYGPTWSPTAPHTLDFLEDFPGLEHLHVNLPGITSLEPLRFVEASLKTLWITGFDKNAKLSLAPVARCRKLTSLTLTRTPKDIETIWELPQLEHLAVCGLRDSDLQPPGKLAKLRVLELSFGGMEQIDLVTQMPNLAALTILRTRGLADLAPIRSLQQLQFLSLADLAQAKVFPDCKPLGKLRRVFLDTMNGLADLRGLAAAPRLEELIVINSKMTAAPFAPLATHKALQRVEIGLASRSATKEVEVMFGSKNHTFFGTPQEKFTLSP